MSRVCFVTGAGSGIGAQLVRSLLALGEQVAAADINTAAMEPLRRLAGEDRLMILKLDVRDAAAWDSAIKAVIAQWGRLDVMMNVAGVLRSGYCWESTAADIDFHLDINAKGAMLGTQAAARVMVSQGHGHIINIASLAGLAPVPGLSLYSASKFALRGYSLAAAMELREKNVKLTVVCPDAVQTPMLDIQKDDAHAELTFSGKRSLSAQEVADAVIAALDTAPMEIALPPLRGVISKLASFFPAAASGTLERLRKQGRKRQQRERSA
jgi:3-oxoacyl-[acyl-carrier protein] reductase